MLLQGKRIASQMDTYKLSYATDRAKRASGPNNLAPIPDSLLPKAG
jgi:hypothetical protein